MIRRLLTLLVSVALGLVLGEAAIRVVDGHALTQLTLGRGVLRPPSPDVPLEEHLKRVPLAPGVDAGWFEHRPPPLPPPPPEDPELVALSRQHPAQQVDILKRWNPWFVAEDWCEYETGFFRTQYPLRWVFAYPPRRKDPRPSYRMLPNTRYPDAKLAPNRWGYRGPDVEIDKAPNTLRIAFVGASTTVNDPRGDFSYPELIGAWFERWRQAQSGRPRIEIINTAREGLDSADNAAVVTYELLPFEPDFVFYYEGYNEFQSGVRALLTLPEGTAELEPPPVARVMEPRPPEGIVRYSAAARRLSRLRLLAPGEEPDKPAYVLKWPPESPDAVLGLSRILGHLEQMHRALDGIGAQLVMGSFAMLVHDGLVLEPGSRDQPTWDMLNGDLWPLRYRDLRLLQDHQNAQFRRFADQRGLPFVDVAAQMPQDRGLYGDAIHNWPSGMQLRAWIVFNALVPLVAQAIAEGRYPRADRASLSEHPELDPGRVKLRTGCASYAALEESAPPDVLPLHVAP